MNLLLIPAIVSVCALEVLIVGPGIGTLLTLDAGSAKAGREIRRRCGWGGTAAIVFAWTGFLPALVAGQLAGDRAGILVLWASGPVGFLVGVLWPPRKGSM